MAYERRGDGRGNGGTGAGSRGYTDKKTYNDKPGAGKKPYGSKPAYGKKPYGDKPAYGESREGGQSYEKKPYGGRSYGDKPAYGKKPYGDKPAYGESREGGQSYEKKPYGNRSYGDKPAYGKKPYGDKPAYGESREGGQSYEKKPYGNRSYGDKPAYGKKPYGDKPAYGETREGGQSYEKKPYGGRSYGDKPAYGKKPYGDKPAYGETREGGQSYEKKPYGNRSYGDKPAYGKKPYGEKPAYGDRPSYGKKPYERSNDRRPDRQPPEETALPAQQGGEDELPYLIIGRNAVREAVKSGRSIDRILVTKEKDGSLSEIVNLARDRNLLLREVDRKKLDEVCMPFGHGGKTANHQGIAAYAAGVEYCTVADILAAAKEKGEDPFVVVLDGVEDPHNLGSIIRSAECAGAHGVIIGKRRSASVTAAAVKAAAGATEYMKIARVTNINAALTELKRAGCWIAGADMAGAPTDKQGLNGALALVIGSEGDGLTKLVRDSCDFLVSIPMHGRIDSLNAAVAAAVLMFEKRRQDAGKVE